MATRSAIGIITDRYIFGIYCHWDGYPENNGRILVENYKTLDQVWDLIKLGDLSSLNKEVGTKHASGYHDTFCTYYGRDLEGYDNIDYRQFTCRQEFKEHFENSGCEYFYLFNDDQWVMSSLRSNWAPVETYLLTAE